MGKVIDRLATIEEHQTFSSDLAGFALAARKAVEEGNSQKPNERTQGCLIYAGGDDVLALLPLHTALRCARELNAAFSTAVGKDKYEATDNDGTKLRPTLSAGMVIWHHLEPLDEALEAARTAEKTAKSFPGKNAFCVSLSKRSGSETHVVDAFKDLIDRLEVFVDAHVNDDLPDGAAYQLRDMLNHLEGIPEAQLAEATRILKRKNAQASTIEKIIQRFDQVKQDATSGAIAAYAKDPSQNLDVLTKEKLHEAFEQLVNEIIIAKEFAQAKQQRNAVLPQPTQPVLSGGTP
jgi:CRISPR-associated protein Cmr2